MIDALQQVIGQLEQLTPEEQAVVAENLAEYLAQPEWERRLYAQWLKDYEEDEKNGVFERPPRYMSEEEFDAELRRHMKSEKASSHADI